MTAEEAQPWGARLASLLATELGDRREGQAGNDFRSSVSSLRDEIPGDEEERTSFMKVASLEVVEAFRGQPGKWNPLIKWLYLYIDYPLFEKYRKKSESMEGMSKLAARVLSGVLSDSSVEVRIAFIAGIDDWDVSRALALVLPGLSLDFADGVALLNRIDRFTRMDALRYRIMAAVKEWAKRQARLAQRIVDSWLVENPETSCLEEPAIQELVEAVVAADGQESVRWRDEVVGSLQEKNEDRALELALKVAVFAWPEPAPAVEERHAILLRHFSRAPGKLAEASLQALLRDASEFPLASARTASQIVKRLDSLQAGPARLLVAVADVASKAIQRGGDVRSLEFLLDDLLAVGPEQVSGSFDSFLSDLLEVDSAAVEGFLMRWLKRHSQALEDEPLRIRELFRQATRGEEAFAGFVVRCLVDHDAALRDAGALILGQSMRSELPATVVSELSRPHALVMVHEIVSYGVPGAVWVSMIFQFLRSREDLREEMLEILVEDGAVRYPGLCRGYLDQWKKEAENYGATVLEERLSTVGSSLSAKQEIPEILESRPAAKLWAEIEKRQMDSVMERERARSLLSLFPNVPIARGEAAFLGPAGAEPVRLGEVSFATDYDLWEAFDPVGSSESRVRHREQLEQLLQEIAVITP